MVSPLRENLHGKVKIFIGDGFVAQCLELVCGGHGVPCKGEGVVCLDKSGYQRRKKDEDVTLNPGSLVCRLKNKID